MRPRRQCSSPDSRRVVVNRPTGSSKLAEHEQSRGSCPSPSRQLFEYVVWVAISTFDHQCDRHPVKFQESPSKRCTKMPPWAYAQRSAALAIRGKGREVHAPCCPTWQGQPDAIGNRLVLTASAHAAGRGAAAGLRSRTCHVSIPRAVTCLLRGKSIPGRSVVRNGIEGSLVARSTIFASLALALISQFGNVPTSGRVTALQSNSES